MNSEADSSYSRLSKAELSRSHKNPPRPTRVQKILEYTLFTIFGLTIALAGVGLYATSQPEHQLVPNRLRSGVTADRVNVLLIGSSLRTRAGGEPDVVVESLMLLSIQPSTGRSALMSIPVDLWVKAGRYGQRPLRTAHSIGDAAGYPGGGTGLTVDTVERIIGQPVHAYVRFSIGDVHRLVDQLGGIDVDVKHGVYDARSKFRFRRGMTRMDGVHAMRYAYSGNIAGVTASSRPAREERQQEVILALLREASTLPGDAKRLSGAFGSLSATNLSPWNVDLLVRALGRSDEIRRISFEPYLDRFDVTSVAFRGEAARPRQGDFATLQKIADAALVN